MYGPTATWRMVYEALQALEKHPDNEKLRTYAITMLEVLTRWLRRGGFPPKLDEEDYDTL